MKIIAFIFARGNSKGIKNKNFLRFKKTTLLGHAINKPKGLIMSNKYSYLLIAKKFLHMLKNLMQRLPF